MKCALLATFKDILVNSKVEFSDDFQSDVLKLAENIVKEGTTVLRGGGVSSASIKMQHDGLLYIVKLMCSGIELLVWSAMKHEGIYYMSIGFIICLFNTVSICPSLCKAVHFFLHIIIVNILITLI